MFTCVGFVLSTILAYVLHADLVHSFIGYSGYATAKYYNRKVCPQMIFDFLKKRTEEGLSQVQNIATKSLEGKFGEALSESAAYIKIRQKADSENWKKLTTGLSRSRDLLLADISGIFGEGGIGASTSSLNEQLERLEEVLLRADLGSSTASAIIADLRSYARSSGIDVSREDILSVLRSRLIDALSLPAELRGLRLSADPATEGPVVLLIIGANGMGKTTTIGKLAHRIRNELNQTVLLGACDTFRAAAVNQLAEWAVRANVSIERPRTEEEGGDPVVVAERTLRRGKEEAFDVVILDTSGRLANNYALTLQLQEIRDAVRREVPGGPHETLLVVDGSVGRNAVLQAETWRSKVGVTGLVVTKLDGTARGGFVVSVVRDLGLPVKLVGVGEGIEDLRDFEPELFVDALLGNDQTEAQKMRERADAIAKAGGAGVVRTSSVAQSGVGGRGGLDGSGSGGNSVSERLRASFGSDDASAEQGTKKSQAKSKPQKGKQKTKR